jgi:hypothetical protein
MLLVTQIYNTLKQAQLVNTLEEYSSYWLNKHKTNASYLIHKKRDLSLNSKLNCIKNIKSKIDEIENGNELTKNLNNQTLITLKNLQNQMQNTINNDLQIEIFLIKK